MVSRMEKYYKNDTTVKQRSQKNKDLYRSIYDYGEYSNIEGIAAMSKSNEVDITKVQRMLKNREDYKRQKQYRQISKPIEEKEEIVSHEFVQKEQKNYDIRDILSKARDRKPEEDTPRSLDDTNYNILKNLKMNNGSNNHNVYKDYEDDELKELINTITNTSMLNQMNDNELGLNMFDLEEVEGNDSKDSIKQLLEQAKKYEEGKDGSSSNIDNSFFTSSLNFTKEDFEDANSKVKRKKSKNKLLRFLLFISLLVFTFLIIFGVYSLIK